MIDATGIDKGEYSINIVLSDFMSTSTYEMTIKVLKPPVVIVIPVEPEEEEDEITDKNIVDQS